MPAEPGCLLKSVLQLLYYFRHDEIVQRCVVDLGVFVNSFAELCINVSVVTFRVSYKSTFALNYTHHVCKNAN